MKNSKERSRIRKIAFWPAFLLLFGSLVYSIVDRDGFYAMADAANTWVLNHFGWTYSLTSFLCLVAVAVAYFSPLGNVILGGKDAKPILSKKNWATITLCTAMAAGALFWGIAEPVYHMSSPPAGLEPNTWESAKFAMELGILGVICTGTLNMGGALQELSKMESKSTAWLIILAIVTVCFIISSVSGIQKGIKLLSNINVVIYLVILAVLFILGPSMFMIDGTVEAVGGTFSQLSSKLLTTGAYASDPWAKSWTVFYAGSWASWAPISACFLARLGVGYKIKDLIKINFGIPILFNIVWCGVFSNLAINYQLTGKLDLIHILETKGAEGVIYSIFRDMPGSTFIILLFFAALMFSMITAMDSTTNSIAALSTSGISPKEQEAPVFLKVMWGVMFAVLSYIMLTISGIDGIKLVSNLGGLPNIFILLGGVFCVFVISSNVTKYNLVDKVNQKKEE